MILFTVLLAPAIIVFLLFGGLLFLAIAILIIFGDRCDRLDGLEGVIYFNWSFL